MVKNNLFLFRNSCAGAIPGSRSVSASGFAPIGRIPVALPLIFRYDMFVFFAASGARKISGKESVSGWISPASRRYNRRHLASDGFPGDPEIRRKCSIFTVWLKKYSISGLCCRRVRSRVDRVTRGGDFPAAPDNRRAEGERFLGRFCDSSAAG